MNNYTLQNSDIGDNYNKTIPDRYKNNYEFNRWFVSSRHRAEYWMTYRAIDQQITALKYDSVLELGPGPGTWTRLLYRYNPTATMQLIDVSAEMKKQFELEMRHTENVSYDVSDIITYQFDTTFDLFFSSRAVEYLEDKPQFFKKLASVVKAGGRGVVITKNPHQGIRKSPEALHKGQIAMPEMQKYLEEQGFTDVLFYPVVYRVPILSRFSSFLAEYLFQKNSLKQLDVRRKHVLIESYLVTFKQD